MAVHCGRGEERRPIAAGGAQPDRRSGEHRTERSRANTAADRPHPPSSRSRWRGTAAGCPYGPRHFEVPTLHSPTVSMSACLPQDRGRLAGRMGRQRPVLLCAGSNSGARCRLRLLLPAVGSRSLTQWLRELVRVRRQARCGWLMLSAFSPRRARSSRHMTRVGVRASVSRDLRASGPVKSTIGCEPSRGADPTRDPQRPGGPCGPPDVAGAIARAGG